MFRHLEPYGSLISQLLHFYVTLHYDDYDVEWIFEMVDNQKSVDKLPARLEYLEYW